MTRRPAPLIRGNALVNIRSYVLDQHGASALARLCDALDPATGAALQHARWTEWYPASAQTEALLRYDSLFARGDLASIPAIGAHQCARDMASPLGWLFRLISPGRWTENMDLGWRRFHSSGRWSSTVNGGQITARLHAWDGGSAAACAVLRGYLGRLLREMSGGPLELRHPRCAFHGGEVCEFHAAQRVEALRPLPLDPVDGADIPAIGRELAQLTSHDALIEAIVAVLQAHAPGCDAALSLADRDGALVPRGWVGARRVTYEHRWLLEGRGRVVGRLDAQLDRGDPGDPRIRAIGELVPWFAMALASAEEPSRATSATLAERARAAAIAWSLTERQAQVLALLVEGRSNRQIALELACAEGTVEVHVKALFKKASVAGRTELTARVATVAPRRAGDDAATVPRREGKNDDDRS
jgi:DNA-binding CsgD family transcriptional regulator